MPTQKKSHIHKDEFWSGNFLTFVYEDGMNGFDLGMLLAMANWSSLLAWFVDNRWVISAVVCLLLLCYLCWQSDWVTPLASKPLSPSLANLNLC